MHINLRRMIQIYAAILGLVGMFSATAQAQSFDWSGFATVVGGETTGPCFPGSSPTFGLSPAYASSCTRYIADWAHGGVYTNNFSASQETRAGIQGTETFNSVASATMQITSRTNDNQHLNVEWAYLTFKLTPELTLQVGRKRLPMYYYSDFQDVGYAYNTIRPSPDVYGWDVVNYNGVSLDYTKEIGNWNTRSEILFGQENSNFNPFFKITTPIPQDVQWHSIFGVVTEANYDWFTARFSYFHSNFEQFDSATGQPQLQLSGDYKGGQDFVGLALNGDIGNWVLRNEFGNTNRKIIGYAGPFFLSTVGYRMDKFVLTGGVSAIVLHGNIQAFDQRLRSGLVALRYDFMKNNDLKLQFDHVTDYSVGAPFVGNSNVMSLAYDVVF